MLFQLATGFNPRDSLRDRTASFDTVHSLVNRALEGLGPNQQLQLTKTLKYYFNFALT